MNQTVRIHFSTWRAFRLLASSPHVQTKGFTSKYLFMRDRNEQKVRIVCLHVSGLRIGMMPQCQTYTQSRTARKILALKFDKLPPVAFLSFDLYFAYCFFYVFNSAAARREKARLNYEKRNDNNENMNDKHHNHVNNNNNNMVVHDLPLRSSSVSVLAV